MKYDYLIVGAGLFGSCFARIANDNGKRCLVIEKRDHIGGNCFTEKVGSINVHRYGPHIFHTSNEVVWRFVNRFAAFNNYVNSPVALSNGELFSLPFNMYTFNRLWGCITPAQARHKIESSKACLGLTGPAKNLEEQAISMVGPELYERLIRHYTAKQWLSDPKDLSPDIIKRLPLRFTYNNNYFNDTYQGIPIGGYTQIFEKLLEGADIELSKDYLSNREALDDLAHKVVYTGPIDSFFNYKYGKLGYRSLRFEDELHNTDNYQGNAVVNYCDPDVPYTRIIEHQHFEPSTSFVQPTIVTKEYPIPFDDDAIPYYPIDNNLNRELYHLYSDEVKAINNVIFGGRLAQYKYFDMHAVIASAITACSKEGLTMIT